MSLLDGLLRDALLETVMQQNIFLAIRTDAPAGGGSGTWENPFYAGAPTLTDSQNADLFDGIMSDPDKVPEGSTVFLGPGTFMTRGSAGWTPNDGLRIVGSGIKVTTIKRVGFSSNVANYAIGDNGSGLNGFEAADFTIDCNYAGGGASDYAAAGISVGGTHVYLRRIRAINFGSDYGTATNTPVFLAAGDNSENCVIEECIAELPDTSPSGSIETMTLFALGGTSANPHRFCVIRNCAGRGKGAFDPPPAMGTTAQGLQYHGIGPGAGIGTLIEGNQIANCGYGLKEANGATKDLVIWNNYFRNPYVGIDLGVVSYSVGRISILDNIIDLANNIGALSNQTGIKIAGVSNEQIGTAIIRKNVIRDVTNAAGVTSGLRGMDLSRCKELVVENNIVNNAAGDQAVRFGNCSSSKFFNNQDTAGKLLRGYNTVTSLYAQELEDAVQDVLLPV